MIKPDVLTNIQHKSGVVVKYLYDIYINSTGTLFYIFLRSTYEGHIYMRLC